MYSWPALLIHVRVAAKPCHAVRCSGVNLPHEREVPTSVFCAYCNAVRPLSALVSLLPQRLSDGLPFFFEKYEPPNLPVMLVSNPDNINYAMILNFMIYTKLQKKSAERSTVQRLFSSLKLNP